MGFLLLLGRAHRRRCSAALGTAGRRRRFGNIAASWQGILVIVGRGVITAGVGVLLVRCLLILVVGLFLVVLLGILGRRFSLGCRHLEAGRGFEIFPGQSATARLIKVRHSTAGSPPPVISPRESLLSSPIQTAQARLGVKPTNQASRYSLVVPVLPAAGRLMAAARPVPRVITSRIIEISI